MNEVRLIDANALKEDFKTRLADCNEWIGKAKNKETKIRASAIKAFIIEVIMTIDNAPTVNGIVGFVERPKGKWKFIQGATTQGSLKCPFCDYRDYRNTNSNFCPNCGAKMRS